MWAALRESQELIIAVLTLVTGIIGWFTAKAKQKQQVEVILRHEQPAPRATRDGGAGAGAGAGASAQAAGPAIRLAASWWVLVQSLSLMLIYVSLMVGLFFVPMALLFDRSRESFIFILAVLGGIWALPALGETLFFVWEKLAGPVWWVDGAGITMRRFGRQQRVPWVEAASLRALGRAGLGVDNSLTLTIGHEGGARRSIKYLPRELQSRAIGLARTAGVRIGTLGQHPAK